MTGGEPSAAGAVRREILAKAVHDPRSHGDLTLVYERGHELSGTTRIELRGDGWYALATQSRRGERASSQGTLAAARRDAVFAAVEEGRLLDLPSSTRNIADDEQPILVEVRYDDAEHRLRLWAGDARANPGFERFERTLRDALPELGTGTASGS